MMRVMRTLLCKVGYHSWQEWQLDEPVVETKFFRLGMRTLRVKYEVPIEKRVCEWCRAEEVRRMKQVRRVR